MPTDGCRELDSLAEWSDWIPISDALALAPRTAGVYVARQTRTGPVVYVGMAGERNGKGIRGRLGVYLSGKALASGLGEAVFDRALADPDWLKARLREVDAGEPTRAKRWGQAAFERADLHIRWATTPDRASAFALEHACLEALQRHDLWNRLRPSAPDDVVTIAAALGAVTRRQWDELAAATDELLRLEEPACRWESPAPTTEVIDGVVREVHHFGYPVYADPINAVVRCLYELGLIVSVDWMTWSGAQRDLHSTPIPDSATAVMYLTAVVRGERFSDGAIETALESGRFVAALQALRSHQRISPGVTSGVTSGATSAPPRYFDPDLLRRIRDVLSEGDVVTTLSHGRPNVIGRIDQSGIEVTTERSDQRQPGKPRFVPAWMFNLVWHDLQTNGQVDRDAVAERAGRKVKRASAVFAIIEQFPEVRVAKHTSLRLEFHDTPWPSPHES